MRALHAEGFRRGGYHGGGGDGDGQGRIARKAATALEASFNVNEDSELVGLLRKMLEDEEEDTPEPEITEHTRPPFQYDVAG